VRRFFYACLLRCYPPPFRRRFGAELGFAFDAGWRQARGRGAIAAIRFLLASAADAAINGARERRSNRWYSPRAPRDPFMTTLVSDLRFGLRLMARNPRLAVLAVCTLGLGIGLSVSLYSVAHGALVRPLPFRDESRVVMMYEYAPQKDAIKGNVAPANFFDWRERTRAFSHMGGLRPFSVTVTSAGGEPVRADGRRILGDAFGALGLDPVAGRLFTPEDERAGSHVVILSHRLWQQHFGSDPSLIGRSVMLDEVPHTVVGVLEPVLRVPGGPVGYDAIFVPWVLTPQLRQARMSHIMEAVGRVKAGITLEQAQADVATVAQGLAREHPQSNKDETVLLVPLREALVGEVKPALVMLTGAVTLVLLIACVNVANLLLARATARRQEMTVRAALGAGRSRLFRQLLAESLLLAAIAGGVGLMLAYRFVELMGVLLPADLGAAVDVRLDSTVALGALGVCVLTAVIFGLAPAWFVLRGRAPAAVRDGRGGTPPSTLARRTLVVVQVALAVVLLTGAGLLVRSFSRLTSVDPGFRADHLLTLRIELPRSRYDGPRQWQPFFERLRGELRSIPGVVNAAGVSGLPLNENGGSVGFHAEGHPVPADNNATFVIYRLVTPGYFSTIGIPMLEGRDFSSEDRVDGAPVVAVNHTLAKRYWPGQSAIGKRVAFTTTPKPEDWATVVAVVGDTRHSSLAEAVDLQLYVPYTQEPNWYPPGQLVLRTSGEPSAVAPAVRERVRAIDPSIPVSDINTMEGIIARSVAAPRFHLTLVSLLSVSALALATIGIYGLLAFSVALRTREIGVRSALGASGPALARMFLGEGLRLAGTGIAVGLLIAFVATRWLETLLFEVTPHDPATFAGIAALLLGIAVLACYVPARRAARVDPLVALRTE
jgi:putative ABC transport system permease protein